LASDSCVVASAWASLSATSCIYLTAFATIHGGQFSFGAHGQSIRGANDPHGGQIEASAAQEQALTETVYTGIYYGWIYT